MHPLVILGLIGLGAWLLGDDSDDGKPTPKKRKHPRAHRPERAADPDGDDGDDGDGDAPAAAAAGSDNPAPSAAAPDPSPAPIDVKQAG